MGKHPNQTEERLIELAFLTVGKIKREMLLAWVNLFLVCSACGSCALLLYSVYPQRGEFNDLIAMGTTNQASIVLKYSGVRLVDNHFLKCTPRGIL